MNNTMESISVRGPRLNVLAVLAFNDPACTAIAPALGAHHGLMCEGAEQALAAVERDFPPDVVIIDSRLPDAEGLPEEVAPGSRARRFPSSGWASRAGRFRRIFRGRSRTRRRPPRSSSCCGS